MAEIMEKEVSLEKIEKPMLNSAYFLAGEGYCNRQMQAMQTWRDGQDQGRFQARRYVHGDDGAGIACACRFRRGIGSRSMFVPNFTAARAICLSGRIIMRATAGTSG